MGESSGLPCPAFGERDCHPWVRESAQDHFNCFSTGFIRERQIRALPPVIISPHSLEAPELTCSQVNTAPVNLLLFPSTHGAASIRKRTLEQSNDSEEAVNHQGVMNQPFLSPKHFIWSCLRHGQVICLVCEESCFLSRDQNPTRPQLVMHSENRECRLDITCIYGL